MVCFAGMGLSFIASHCIVLEICFVWFSSYILNPARLTESHFLVKSWLFGKFFCDEAATFVTRSDDYVDNKTINWKWQILLNELINKNFEERKNKRDFGKVFGTSNEKLSCCAKWFEQQLRYPEVPSWTPPGAWTFFLFLSFHLGNFKKGSWHRFNSSHFPLEKVDACLCSLIHSEWLHSGVNQKFSKLDQLYLTLIRWQLQTK